MGEQSRQEKNGHSTERVKVGQSPHGDSGANKTRSHVAGNKGGPLHVHIIYPCQHVKIVNHFYTCQNRQPFKSIQYTFFYPCQNSKHFLHMSNIVHPFLYINSTPFVSQVEIVDFFYTCQNSTPNLLMLKQYTIFYTFKNSRLF